MTKMECGLLIAGPKGESMAFFGFHPIIEQWFRSRFDGPTEPQEAGWPDIAEGAHTLIAAPTGSGKTLTAFLSVIDRLFRLSLAGDLEDETRVVYISPLRALSNDMHRNLEVPLQEILALATAETLEAANGTPITPIKTGLRTGDTSASRRATLVKRPPHILVTTPESLYLMLTADKARETLRNVDTVIVDEIHALVRDKRGSHLGLTLERLEAVCNGRLQRIGLSATQRPIERMAEFLTGCRAVGETSGTTPATVVASGGSHDAQPTTAATSRRTHNACRIVDVGHARQLDLAIEVPPSPLGAVCMHEQWAEVNARMVELIQTHHSTLIFVNTRRLAERVTHQLTELLGEDAVGSHHGSLAADIRLQTEQRLKSGQLKAVVATASLELGLDIGYIDLVIQLGSPRSIATFLQRIGRSGHSLGLIPKGRLFALTRDELFECMGLIRAVRGGRLDVIPIPETPLDVLAQQIVAEVAAREWGSDELFETFRRAYSYRNLTREQFDETVKFLSEGLTRAAGRGRVYLHHDQVGKRLRARKGARIAATSNGGAIPEIASYRVVVEPEQTVVGTLDEEFAVESTAGSVFLLGNTSWRIQHVRGGDVTVTDAGGAPPTIPFWQGEAPGRTRELSEEVSRLREDLEQRVAPLLRTDVRIELQDDVQDDQHRQTKVGVHSPAQAEAQSESSLMSMSADDAVAEFAADVPGSLYDPTAVPNDETGGPDSTGGLGETDGSGETGVWGDTAGDLGGDSRVGTIARWLVDETQCSEFAAQQAIGYAMAQKAAIGLLPNQRTVVFERFFDESGGMQLVIHAPFGARINQAWGLAMRKRFCRSFDFELQATADDDGVILSLGPQHSFPLESLFPMLTAQNAQALLEQAILAVPMFQVRWRWNVTRALQVLRRNAGKKVPPALQRFRADDLLTSVFPTVTGCLENVVGDIELPDHPLTRQTMDDCLHEALDIDGLHDVLGQVGRGEIQFIARDTREPSPFCYELLNSNPYAFLDGGEVQERRARAVSTRRTLTVEAVSDLGRLDPEAIERVRSEAQPLIRDADELHDALLSRIVLPTDEVETTWQDWFHELADQHRAATLHWPDGRTAWVAAERLPAALAVFPEATIQPTLEIPAGVRTDWPSTEARVAILRGLLETSGPITADEAALRTGVTVSQAFAALEALEGEGIVLRGHFTPQRREDWFSPDDSTTGDAPAGETGDSAMQNASPPSIEDGVEDGTEGCVEDSVEWCHRRLLARIHRLTMEGLRKQIEPVEVDVFMRDLMRQHGLLPEHQRSGTNGLFEVVSLLQGMDIPAICWERDLLPARLAKYRTDWLDELCLTGEVGWGRLFPPKRNNDRSRPMASLTRVAPVSVFLRSDLAWLSAAGGPDSDDELSGPGAEILEILQARGAMFASDLLQHTRMLPSQLDDVLGELVTRGLVTSDGFAGLRQLIADKNDSGGKRSRRARTGIARRRSPLTSMGRWSVWRQPLLEGGAEGHTEADTTVPTSAATDREIAEEWAWQLLRRWGVVFRDLLIRESGAPRWFELLQVYRKLEARGEIRGGRFIKGVAGEQFALGESVRRLRALRDAGPQQELVFLSAADPLNLVGIVTRHARIPSTASNRIVWLDGRPLAMLRAGEYVELAEVPADLQGIIQERFGLRGSAMPRSLTVGPNRNNNLPSAERMVADKRIAEDAGTASAQQPATKATGDAAVDATGDAALPETSEVVGESSDGEKRGKSAKKKRGERRYPNKIPRPMIS